MESALDVVSASRQTRYLKTTANATVDHLAKFLVTRIKLDRDEADRSSSGASFSSLVEKNSESTAKGDENISPTISQSSKLILPNELNVDLALKSTETCKLYVVCGGGPPLMSLASSGLTELNGDMTLDYVLIKMWGIKKPLEMYFSLSDEKIPSQSTIQFNNYPPATKPENNKLNNK